MKKFRCFECFVSSVMQVFENFTAHRRLWCTYSKAGLDEKIMFLFQTAELGLFKSDRKILTV